MDLLQHLFRKARPPDVEGEEEPAKASGESRPRRPAAPHSHSRAAIQAAVRWGLDREHGLLGRLTGGGNGPALAPKEVILVLDDVLARIPTECLQPGLHDPDRELRLPTEDLVKGIARGRATIPLATLAARFPDIFQLPPAGLRDVAVQLPLQKLLQQLGGEKLPAARRDPVAAMAVAIAADEDESPENEALFRPSLHGDLLGAAQPGVAAPLPEESFPEPALPRTGIPISHVVAQRPAPKLEGAAAGSTDPSAPGSSAGAPSRPPAGEERAPETTPVAPEIFGKTLPVSRKVENGGGDSRRGVAAQAGESAAPPVAAVAPEELRMAAARRAVAVAIEAPPPGSRFGEQNSKRQTGAPEGPTMAVLPPPPPFAPPDASSAMSRRQPRVVPPPLTLPIAPAEVVGPAPGPPAKPPSPPVEPTPEAATSHVHLAPPVRAFIRPPSIQTYRAGEAPEQPVAVTAADPPPSAQPASSVAAAPAYAAEAAGVPADELGATLAEVATEVSSSPPPITQEPPGSPAPLAGVEAERITAPEGVPASPLRVDEEAGRPNATPYPEPETPAEDAPSSAMGEPLVTSPVAPSNPLAGAASPEYPLERIEQEPLQAIFMTDEMLDLPRISELSANLPGVTGCLIVAGETMAQGGERPAGLDAPTLRELSAQLISTADAVGDRLPAERTFTLYGGNRALSIFARDALCLCVVHGVRGFLPGVRERLNAVADTLARGAVPAHGES
jgi:hypothetical protein